MRTRLSEEIRFENRSESSQKGIKAKKIAEDTGNHFFPEISLIILFIMVILLSFSILDSKSLFIAILKLF